MKRLILTIFLMVALGVVAGWGASSLQRMVGSETAAVLLLPPEPTIDEAVAYWIQQIDVLGAVEAYQEFIDYNNQRHENMQHTNAHYFGEALYKTMGVDGVAVCDNTFAFGCYHALFSWGLADLGTSIIGDFDTACIATYGEKGLGCQHGIGHGLMADMGEERLIEVLELCATLAWQGPIGGCTSGVFMEYNFNTMWEGPIRQVADGQDLHFPCTVVPERFTQACYFEMPQWWTALKYNDFTFAGSECSSITRQHDRAACYRGLGNEAAGDARFDIPLTLEICSRMPDQESELLCIEGATWLMAFEPVRADDWQLMCDKLAGEAKDRCLASKDFI